MKALVTGSTGLIGSCLVNRLKGLSWEVEGSNSTTPTDFTQSYDAIFHLGCYSSPKRFMGNPIKTIKSNTVDLMRLLDKAVRDKSKFLFASSSQIYGDATVFPTPEDYPGNVSPLSYRAPYSESKRLGETICACYKDTLTIKIARISQVYGPGYYRNDGRVISDFIEQALAKKEIRLLDKGDKVFVWLYVEDCVTMLLNILMGGKELVYNIAGNESAAISDIAKWIGILTDSQVVFPENGKSLKDSPSYIQPDMTRYNREFFSQTKTPIIEGLEKTIKAYRNSIRS
jgi:UDP-glucuronate decarboxylase